MTLEDWNLFDGMQAWKEATLGTVEERKAKLSKPELRKEMREDYDTGGMDTMNVIFGEFDKFIARKVRNTELKLQYEGMSVEQIAEKEGKHVIDAMLDLSVADDLRTEWAGPVANANIEGYKELMSSPYTLPGVSDGGAHVKFITPAIYPTEVLSWLVREAGHHEPGRSHFRLSGIMAWRRVSRIEGRYVQAKRPTSWSTTPIPLRLCRARLRTICRLTNGGGFKKPKAIRTSWSTVKRLSGMVNALGISRARYSATARLARQPA